MNVTVVTCYYDLIKRDPHFKKTDFQFFAEREIGALGIVKILSIMRVLSKNMSGIRAGFN